MAEEPTPLPGQFPLITGLAGESCEGGPVEPGFRWFSWMLEESSEIAIVPDGAGVYRFSIPSGNNEYDAAHVLDLEQENARLRSLLARVLDPLAWEQGLREEIEAELAEESEEGNG